MSSLSLRQLENIKFASIDDAAHGEAVLVLRKRAPFLGAMSVITAIKINSSVEQVATGFSTEPLLDIAS